MAETDNLQQQLAMLAQLFAERLKNDLPEIAASAALIQEAAAGESRQAHLQLLRQQLHKLAGAAGTFGFAGLGQRARELELQSAAWLTAEVIDEAALPDFIQALLNLQQLAHTPPAEPVQQGLQPLSNGPEAASGDNGQRIAILEDDAEMGRSIELTLRNFGYDAHWFATTSALESVIDERTFDVLITDVDLGMSEPDGLEYSRPLLERLNLSLLVISNKTDFTTQLRAVRAGAIGFLPKPINLPALENTLQRCFARQQGEPYRILIVDDDHELARHYSLVLGQSNMLVEVCNDPITGLEAMHRSNPEVVVLDVHMPGCSGPELAQIIRFQDEWLRVPIVYLSAETDLAKQMGALLRAGDDFVTKPISDSALVTTVFSRAQRARLLSNALARDSLTGLLKHADIKEQIAVEVERSTRNGSHASIVMLDIDHFKRVNDRYGHAAGDNVIRALANLLRQRLRRVDSLGRYGGEEFAAVLPDCTAVQAKRIIDEIRERFSELSFVANGATFNVTLSSGIAQTDHQSAGDVLLERADQALYCAKDAGRNRVLMYSAIV